MSSYTLGNGYIEKENKRSNFRVNVTISPLGIIPPELRSPFYVKELQELLFVTGFQNLKSKIQVILDTNDESIKFRAPTNNTWIPPKHTIETFTESFQSQIDQDSSATKLQNKIVGRRTTGTTTAKAKKRHHNNQSRQRRSSHYT